jgi:hypothetical protein
VKFEGIFVEISMKYKRPLIKLSSIYSPLVLVCTFCSENLGEHLRNSGELSERLLIGQSLVSVTIFSGKFGSLDLSHESAKKRELHDSYRGSENVNPYK